MSKWRYYGVSNSYYARMADLQEQHQAEREKEPAYMRCFLAGCHNEHRCLAPDHCEALVDLDAEIAAAKPTK